MILDDFIMLGTTVPEPCSDGRVFVCSAGYSPELRSLVRVYPLARRGAPNRWKTYRVPLERNPRDSRSESWSVRADRSPQAHHDINAAFVETGRVKPRDIAADLERHTLVDSIGEANARRLSLAIVRPTSFKPLTFDYNPDSPDAPQLALFELGEQRKITAGAKRFPYNPRLEFTDGSGTHRWQVREWGGYEYMRKNPCQHRKLDFHINEGTSLLVGNMNHQRNAWLIVAVLNGVRGAKPAALFDGDTATVP